MQNHPLSPLRISGPGFEGWALGPHTEHIAARSGALVKRRTAPAEAMYRYRYQAEVSLLPEIAQRFASALPELYDNEKKPFNGVVMVPPPLTRADYAPVVALVAEISRRTGIPSLQFAVRDDRESDDPGPGPRDRRFTFSSPVVRSLFAGKRLLVLDDIYRSGKSLHAFCSLIKQEGGAAEVAAVVGTMTGTGV